MRVKLTHPDKILFPKGKITKQEVFEYYDRISDKILTHLKGRPLTMECYPLGIQEDGYFLKSLPKGTPQFVDRVKVPRKERGPIEMLVCNNKSTLLWMVNQNCITPHIWLSKKD